MFKKNEIKNNHSRILKLKFLDQDNLDSNWFGFMLIMQFLAWTLMRKRAKHVIWESYCGSDIIASVIAESNRNFPEPKANNLEI